MDNIMSQTEPVLAESVPKMKTLSFQTSGHTQKSRSLLALANDYFSVEERTFQGWFNYVYDFSKHFSYIDYHTLEKNDHWQSAMPNKDQVRQLENLLNGLAVDDSIRQLAKRPDIVLLMSFFQMMAVPKAQFDHFTHEHKQYFYRDLLLFNERAEVADKAHIVINLIDSVSSKTVNKGTQFRGGQDIDGKKRVYKSTANAVLNHSRVSQVISLSQLSASKQLLLTQGFDNEQSIDYPEDGMLTFGEEAITNDERQIFSQLGFTLSSQELYLSGGHRTVNIFFKLKDNSSWLSGGIVTCFDLRISTADGLLALGSENVKEQITTQGINLEISLDEFFPATYHFVDDAQPLLPKLAHIEFALKEDCLDEKEHFSNASFESVILKVNVEGLGGIIANHDNGALDTSKPFEPFTYSPKIGSKFQFSHPELLAKNIQNANLELFWVGRPKQLSEYYAAYQSYRDGGTTPLGSWVKNAIKVSYSDSIDTQNIENIFSDNDPLENIDRFSFTFFNNSPLDGLEEGGSLTDPISKTEILDYSQLPFGTTTATQWPKWFTLTLSGNDFGHNEYAQVAQYHGLKNQQATVDPKVLVNQPYTPLLEKILIGYSSEVELNLQNLQQTRFHELKHIHPLGRPCVESAHSKNIALLPKLDELGYLYVGVANVKVPGQFRLYFQLEPVDGSNTTDSVTLDWSYLDNGQWTTFSRSQGGRLQSRGRIIEDSTFNLLDSGIVTFEVPEMKLADNFLGNDLFWIRISIEDQIQGTSDVAKYSRIKSIYAQGIEVVLESGPHHSSHYSQPLEANSINSQVSPDPQVSEILQPYPSFSAKESETPQALEIRAAERIRHKNRALTCWDYEHLVLAQFPELFMARCYRNDQTQVVEVVVVPINHDPKVLQPKVPLFLKRRIQRYLSDISTTDIEVRVVDPVYEEVTFKITLNIVQDYDMDSAVAHLNQILIDYMTPWNKLAVQNSQSQSNTVYLTQVGMELERHPAVDIIYSLVGKVNDKLHSQSISPSSNAVILVPVADHEITLLNQISEIFEGVGQWKIEDDFVVS